MAEQREMLAAWMVLEDAARSINLAVHSDEHHWRVHWAGSLALLRAVGHVLDKVDGARSATHKACSKEWWRRWNPAGGTEHRPNIFASFIEEERNLILKEYAFRFDPAERHKPIALRSGALVVLRGGTYLAGRDSERFVITEGVYAHRDGRELLQEAHLWWTQQLSALDARVVALRSTGGGA